MMGSERWWNRGRSISIVIDPQNRWIHSYAKELFKLIEREGRTDDRVQLLEGYQAVEARADRGEIAFFLGCTRLAGERLLKKHRRTLVVHESALPQGRGFAPVAWQVLEGALRIPFCLIEAVKEPDAGQIFLQDEIVLEGHELNEALRRKQGEATVDICWRYLQADQEPVPRAQLKIKAREYRRRTPADSRLDPQQTLADQFDLLRVVDNEQYPAFFHYRGHRYQLTIKQVDPHG